ncbi:hypothetical protein FOXG_19902 [Fusarium oxysporum f. sp. lycopersici 4287]|uniref:Uncharacterized protein n=1 Tax=Fusarium oxysporum f. sp. lycopersici (strain 4287 / CBS 123668 / FGSC 9935 / NRRL 34936) TaxID=426428 RepID=A0A0J9WNR6_FUSO4|nr:hypothetical protein FOXG_19902 [Fusarium oxysporum f. sp. lycopersici 4287]KNB07747.1 hypothetical protein FOXG_19902 [Fusarium oxysporum f. sp. lycopersici 4287]
MAKTQGLLTKSSAVSQGLRATRFRSLPFVIKARPDEITPCWRVILTPEKEIIFNLLWQDTNVWLTEPPIQLWLERRLVNVWPTLFAQNIPGLLSRLNSGGCNSQADSSPCSSG